MEQKGRALPKVGLRCLIAFAVLTIVGLAGLALYAWMYIGIDAIILVFVIDILVVIGVVVLLIYNKGN